MRLGTGVDARCICARVQARRPRHGARRAAPGAAPQPGGTSSRPSRTIYTTLCACSSAVALWHCRARCLAPSCYLPHEETKRAHQGESSRVMQQRRAGMQVQGCDARPGACGRAHQGRRWCGRRRRNGRFVDRPLVSHPLAPRQSTPVLRQRAQYTSRDACGVLLHVANAGLSTRARGRYRKSGAVGRMTEGGARG